MKSFGEHLDSAKVSAQIANNSADIAPIEKLEILLQQIAEEEKKPDDENHLGTYRIHLRALREALENENKAETISDTLKIIDEQIKHITEILVKKKTKSRMKRFAEGESADEVIDEKHETKREVSYSETVETKIEEKKQEAPEHEDPEILTPVISEEKTDRDPLPPRLVVNVIAYLAKKYINQINSSEVYDLDPLILERLFQDALSELNKSEPIKLDDKSTDIVMKIFNTRPTAYSVSDVNARKIVALLAVYTKSINFLQANNTQERISAWQELQKTIDLSANDLQNNFSKKYSTFLTSPKRYVDILSAISIAGRIYINEAAISSIVSQSQKSEEDKIKLREKLEKSREPYKTLFESHEEAADGLLTNKKTYDEIKQINASHAEENLKDITQLDEKKRTQTLYDLLDFSSLTYAEISQKIKTQCIGKDNELKNRIINQLNHIYEYKLLSTDYNKLQHLKEELYTNPEKKHEILSDIETILTDLSAFIENRTIENKNDQNIPILENTIRSLEKPLIIESFKLLSILIENKENSETLEQYKNQLAQIIRTMCQNKLSISTLIGDAAGNNIENCHLILNSIAGGKSTKNAFFKQLNNAQIDREGITEACQYCFELSDDPANLIQQKPFAHSILEHPNANDLPIDSLLRLSTYLTLEDAIDALDHNPAIEKSKKDAILTALRDAQNFNEVIEFNPKDFHASSKKLYDQIRKCIDNHVNIDLLRIKLNATNESKILEKLTKTLNTLYASGLPFNNPEAEDEKNVRAVQNIISVLLLIKSNSATHAIDAIIKILTPEMAHEIFDKLPDDVKAIYAKQYLNRIDVGYDLALMSEMPDNFKKSGRGVIYIDSNKESLEYKVVDKYNTLRSGTISWHQLNFDFTNPSELIKNKKQILPLIVNELEQQKNAQSKVKSPLTSSYFKSLAESKTDFADLFEIYSRSEDDTAKHQTLASAIIANENMRQWLLEHKVEYRSVIATLIHKLSSDEPDSQLLKLFDHWSKEDLDKALSLSKPDHQWLIYLALLSNKDVLNSDNPEIFNHYLNQLELHKLTPRQIELIPKNIRIAYLKNLGPWINGKALLSGIPPSDLTLREKSISLTKNFGPDDIQQLCQLDEKGNTYETALMTAFGQPQHMDAITSFITSDEPGHQSKKKLSWSLISELDHGIWNKNDNSQLHTALNVQHTANMAAREILQFLNGALYYAMENTLGAIGKAPTEGSAPINDDSFRNRLMMKSVYDYDENDTYTPEMCELVKLECITNSAYFFENAKLPAIKMALKDPEILEGLFKRAELLAIMQKITYQGLLPSELSEIIDSFNQAEQPENISRYHISMLLSSFPMSLSTYFDKEQASTAPDDIEKEKRAIIKLYDQYASYPFNTTTPEAYNSYTDNKFIKLLNDKYDPGKPNADFIKNVMSEITFANPLLLDSLLKKHKDHTPEDSTAKKWIKRILKGALMGIGVFLVAKLFAFIIPKVAGLFLSSSVLGPIAGVMIAGAGATAAVLGGVAIVPILIALSVSAAIGALVYSVAADRIERLGKKLKGGPSKEDKLDYQILKQGLTQIKDDDINTRKALFIMSNDFAKTILYHQSIGQDMTKEAGIPPDIMNFIKLSTTKCYNENQSATWKRLNMASHPLLAMKIKTQFNPAKKVADAEYADISDLAQKSKTKAILSEPSSSDVELKRAPSSSSILRRISESASSNNLTRQAEHQPLSPSKPPFKTGPNKKKKEQHEKAPNPRKPKSTKGN